MDKELPKSHFEVKPHKVFVKLSEQAMPNGESFYRGSVSYRETLDVEDLIDRIIKRGTYSHRETLIADYRAVVDEIYRAFEEGFNVDFDLGRTEMTVNGCFNGPYDQFDRERHSFNVCLRPSPRLNQITRYVPAETDNFSTNSPYIFEVNIFDKPTGLTPLYPFNTVPADYDRPLFIHGKRLKLMGDLPAVGITLRKPDSGESYFIPSHQVVINSSTKLCLYHRIALTPGEWVVEVATQFNPSYRLYKQARRGEHCFIVSDATAP